MPTAPHVIATTYIDVCGTGRNRPCRFSCVNDNNYSQDYIVKFFGAIGSQIICEYMAALVGKRLGINVPDMAVVHIDPRTADFIGDETARDQLKKHNGPHFGSRDVGPGVAIVNPGYSLTSEALEQAIDIFAFDMFIQNTDRSAIGVAGNPNVLFRGNELFPIDHELAFSFVNLIGSESGPWQLRDTDLTKRHIFYARLKTYAHNHVISFERFLNNLAELRAEDIESMVQTLPNEWYNDRYVDKITQHCRLVLSNVDKFRRSLLEVFI